MSHVYPDPIQGPNSPLAKSFSYEPMPHCPQLVFNQVTLRDYFAAAALQGMMAQFDPENELEHHIAKWSYKAADAMIKAREAK